MPAAKIVSSVQRADSLRSERSDASLANKRVSFNRDVDVKHISQQQLQQQQQQQQQVQQHQQVKSKGLAPSPPGISNNVSAVAAALDRHDITAPPVLPFYNVYKEPTLLSEAELAQEAERIIQQVDQISCTVSPNPLLANYETRSLERRNLAAAKRNNQQQLHDNNGHNWSRTLPTSSTKNQLLDKATTTTSSVGGGSNGGGNKKTKNVEKNNILHQQHIHHQQLDPIVEANRIGGGGGGGVRRPHQQQQTQPIMTADMGRNGNKQNRDAATTPPKYDSGIEMEAATSRPNVNQIVQQLTEEARQRDLLRRQYQEELLMNEDPLAPRLPTLNLIEPDPQFGLTHNKNLPFSYTGGSSPTRISPLRSPGGRFSSPPPRPEPPGKAADSSALLASSSVNAAAATKKDVVYAQVNVMRDRSQSPERNVFRSSNGAADKVPARGKFNFQQHQTSEVIRRHLRYPQDDFDEDEPEEAVDDDDLDAIKAKARFLFGDDGGHHQTDGQRKLSGGRGVDVRNNNNRNGMTHQSSSINNHVIINNSQNSNGNGSAPGLSYKYSTLLKDRPPAVQQTQPDPIGRSYTTKILIGSEQQQQSHHHYQQQQMQQRKRQEQQQHQQRVFQYSDDDDFGRDRIGYKDRSLSPEPRIEPLTSRIRSLQIRTSPERYRGQPQQQQQQEQESRTLPLVNHRKSNQTMASTRLIQEAERGRAAIRTRPSTEFTSSRLVQQQLQQSSSIRYADDEMDGPPKPPLRIKKLSRERTEGSPPPRTTGVIIGSNNNNNKTGKVAFNTSSSSWNQHTDGSESSPERTTYPLNRSSVMNGNNNKNKNNNNNNSSKRFSTPYMYRGRSITPSPERRIDGRRWNDPPGQESDTTSARTTSKEPEKQEKIRRQRSKFLSVFLGSKANKSKAPAPPAPPPPLSSSGLSPPPPPAAPASGAMVVVKSPAVKEVRGQAPPVAKWSAEDEAELVRQSRSLLSKGQSHQTATRVIRDEPATTNAATNGTSVVKSPVISARSSAEHGTRLGNRKTTPPSAVDLRYRVVSNKDRNRRSSTDRTDTSESDEVNHQRFKSLRQKSQSFNNLNYRPDPVVVLGEEQQQQQQHLQQVRRQQHANGDWDQSLDNSKFRSPSSHRYPDNNNLPEVVVDGGRYKQQQVKQQQPQQQRGMGDARPYASTNLIHQVGQEREEPRRPPPLVAEQPRRQMRYFGDTDLESQPSRGGGYSSRYQPKAKVLRSASTAAGMGAVRSRVLQRGQKQPVSSVNSSESDGSAMQSAASAESQRSVYLHATTVADIPTVMPVTNSARAQQMQAARRKAQSREDMSALSGATGATGSTLRRTRQISRSYSVLAPWKPRHYRDKFEITYSNQQHPASPPLVADAGKPPRVPIRRREDVILESEDSADVYRPAAVAQRQQPPPSASKSGATVTRSSTMPKNSKLMAGWFRKKKQR